MNIAAYYNVYGLLGPEALRIEPFPSKLNPIDRPVYNGLYDEFQPKKVRGRVYFLRDPVTKDVKIGWSGRPTGRRVRDLQTGNPRVLEVITSLSGTKSDEQELQRRFKAYKVEGTKEWFRPAPALLGFIGEIR